MTGRLFSPEQYQGGYMALSFEGIVDPAKTINSDYVRAEFGLPDAATAERLKSLSMGQTVVVRGVGSRYVPNLSDCEIVSVGPSTAIPVTPSALYAALKTEAGKKQFLDRDVVMRAEVRAATFKNPVTVLKVWDPGVSTGPGLEATINPPDSALAESLGKTKIGTVLVLIGEAEAVNDGRIWNFRVLNAPPVGVTLP
jgi:hypothetical protein